VLDHDHVVARVHLACQHRQELLHVVEVQAGGGLVEDVRARQPVEARGSEIAEPPDLLLHLPE